MESPDFKIKNRGLVFRILPHHVITSKWTILVTVGVAWGPLLVLSAAAGLAIGHTVKMPLLADPVPYARLLIGIPLLLGGRAVIHRRLADAAAYLWASDLLKGDDRTRFRDAWRHLAHAGESIVVDIVALIIAYFAVLLMHTEVTQDDYSTWFSYDRGSGEQLTPAGWWYSFVSMPLFSYLLVRSLWRMIAWWRFLWRLSRMDLRLLPTHPDRAGGLGILEMTQLSLVVLVITMSSVLAANLAGLSMHEGVELFSEIPAIVAYAVLAILLVVGPLLVFMGKLYRTKQRGLIQYGDLGDDLFAAFEHKWTNRGDEQQRKLLGNPDPSSLADFGYAYEIVAEMRLVPFSRQGLITVVVGAVGPFAPLLLMDYSLKEVLQRLVGIIG